MTFKIRLGHPDIGDLSMAQIDSFSYMASIFRLYAGAKFILKDMTKTVNNMLKTGMEATVTFQSEEKTYVNEMRILSFNKGSDDYVGDRIEIILISAIYFENEIKTMTHAGPVSQILSNVFTNILKNSAPKIDFVTTEDRARRRYQLGERSQDFAKRITKYAIKGNLPVYLYSAPDGVVHLKGVYDMMTSVPKVVLSSISASKLIKMPNNDSSMSELIYFGHSFSSNTKYTSSLITNVFCTKNFKFPTQLADTSVYTGSDYDNPQAEIGSPPKTKFYNWNLTPDDAMAIAVREAFEETANAYTMSSTFRGLIVDELQLGSTVMSILPYEPTATGTNGSKVNLGEGKYLITQINYIYENKILRTEAHMCQIAS